uniref:Uncharacterized protein n=1 Tax=Romanomermis culicivorax TaxID=13658 RepID=A0A915KEZ8_ROMCU
MSTSLMNIFTICMLTSDVQSYQFLCSEAEIPEMTACANKTLSIVLDMVTKCYDNPWTYNASVGCLLPSKLLQKRCIYRIEILTKHIFLISLGFSFSMTNKCMWNQTVQLFCDCFDQSDEKNDELYRSKFVEKINGWCQSFESALKSEEDQTASFEKMIRNTKISKDDMKFLGSKMADLWGKISMGKNNN